MEAIALHAVLADLSRQRHDFCNFGLAPMETRVETGDLGHSWQTFGDSFDGRQIVRLMAAAPEGSVDEARPAPPG